MRNYTSAEARALLRVDAKTFLRWLEKAGIEPQVSKADNRVKLFTQAQLETLAMLHDRPFNPDEATKAISQTEERFQVLESRIIALEQRLGNLETQLEQKAPAPKMLRPPVPPYEVKASGELPDGLVALRDFYLIHNVPETTAKRAVATGALPTVQGKWKRGRTYITQALDAAGRAAFYERYHVEPYFKLCPDCPHKP